MLNKTNWKVSKKLVAIMLACFSFSGSCLALPPKRPFSEKFGIPTLKWSIKNKVLDINEFIYWLNHSVIVPVLNYEENGDLTFGNADNIPKSLIHRLRWIYSCLNEEKHLENVDDINEYIKSLFQEAMYHFQFSSCCGFINPEYFLNELIMRYEVAPDDLTEKEVLYFLINSLIQLRSSIKNKYETQRLSTESSKRLRRIRNQEISEDEKIDREFRHLINRPVK